MTIQEKQFYEDVRAIRRNINRIADALEAIARNAPSDGKIADNASDIVVSKMVKAMNHVTEDI